MLSIEVGNGGQDSYRRYEAEYQTALSKGWHVAPEVNSDNDQTTWAALPHRVGIIAPSPTRANLIEALRNRRVFSTEDTNLALALQSNGTWMGSSITAQPTIGFTITVQDPEGEQVRLELYDNGRLAWSQSFSGTFLNLNVSLSGSPSHYYYVRAVQEDGDIAYSAPIWTDGTVVVTATATRAGATPTATRTPTARHTATPSRTLTPTRTITPAPMSFPTIQLPTAPPRENRNDLGWVSIETARTTELYRLVRLEGCVTIPPGTWSDRHFYLQDATAGIRIYLSSRHGDFPRLGLNTRVSLRGRTITMLGERSVEIESPSELSILGTCTVLPRTLRTGGLSSSVEGMLVQVTGVLVKTNPWILNDGSGDMEVRADPDTGIRLTTLMRGQRLSITGVVTRYQNRIVLTPRFKSDVVLVQPSSPTPTRTVVRIISPTPSRTPSLTPTIPVPPPL